MARLCFYSLPIHVTLLTPPPLLPQVDSQLPGNMVPGGARRRRRRRQTARRSWAGR